MDPNRKFWNDQQQELRRELSNPTDPHKAIVLFLDQHAMTHSAKMSNAGLWSMADEVLDDMSDAALRWLPSGHEHSIAWILWHLARIEDMTMSVLLAGRPQVFHQGNWPARLNIKIKHSGNMVMDESDVLKLGKTIDLDALESYRIAVGRRTRKIAQTLQPEEFKQKVDPLRLQQLLADGSVPKQAAGLIEYWGNLTKAGLLLMPPTRHNFLHLNEALKVKKKAGKL